MFFTAIDVKKKTSTQREAELFRQREKDVHPLWLLIIMHIFPLEKKERQKVSPEPYLDRRRKNSSINIYEKNNSFACFVKWRGKCSFPHSCDIITMLVRNWVVFTQDVTQRAMAWKAKTKGKTSVRQITNGTCPLSDWRSQSG